MNITSPVLNQISRAPEEILVEFKRFIRQDVSQLLGLCAQSVQKSKLFPTSIREFSSYSQSDWLDVIPVLCALIVACVSPLLLLRNSLNSVSYSSSSKGTSATTSTIKARNAWRYNRVRTWLIRGQGLCYFCGFLTSAVQHRSLWGQYGLSPARSRSSRPTPFFDYVLNGYNDLTLELISFLGLYTVIMMIRTESMLFTSLNWAMYLSIVNMQAPFTYSYGWEWLTCESGFLAIFLCSPPLLRLNCDSGNESKSSGSHPLWGQYLEDEDINGDNITQSESETDFESIESYSLQTKALTDSDKHICNTDSDSSPTKVKSSKTSDPETEKSKVVTKAKTNTEISSNGNAQSQNVLSLTTNQNLTTLSKSKKSSKSSSKTIFPTLETSPYVIALFRLLAFRLLIGAGMSKVGRNSSKCWRDLTCTTTHYFTQPIPNPMSWYFHFLPRWVHEVEVGLTFFEQLCVPFIMLVPHPYVRRFAGCVEIFFQLCIVGTGNYAWINFVGALPCLSLFDDEFVEFVEDWCSYLVVDILYETLICGIFWKIPVEIPMKMILGNKSKKQQQYQDIKSLKSNNFKSDSAKNLGQDFPPKTNSKSEKTVTVTASTATDTKKTKGSKAETDNSNKSKNINKTNSTNTIVRNSKTKTDSNIILSLIPSKSSLHTLFFTLLDLPLKLLRALTCIIYRCSIFGVFMFMILKMKDPLFELFGPAPWINNYDDYFFVTSQGVFGFINRLRVNLVLEYRHSEKDVERKRKELGILTKEQQNLTTNKSKSSKSLDHQWHPLDFKCIPGSIDRTPCLLSPYHSRLDWETWIRTTASLEHVVGQYSKENGMLGQALQQNLPEFLNTLIDRILDGDENAVRLMGTDMDELYYPLGGAMGSNETVADSESDSKRGVHLDQLESKYKLPPSEIRSRYFLYEFQEKELDLEAAHPIGQLAYTFMTEVIADKFIPSICNLSQNGFLPSIMSLSNQSCKKFSKWAKQLGESMAKFTQQEAADKTVAGNNNWYKREQLDISGHEPVYRSDNNGKNKKIPYPYSHPARHWVCGLSLVLAALLYIPLKNLTKYNLLPTITVQFCLFTVFGLCLFSDYSSQNHADSNFTPSVNWISYLDRWGRAGGSYVYNVLNHDVVKGPVTPRKAAKTVFPGLFLQILTWMSKNVGVKVGDVIGSIDSYSSTVSLSNNIVEGSESDSSNALGASMMPSILTILLTSLITILSQIISFIIKIPPFSFFYSLLFDFQTTFIWLKSYLFLDSTVTFDRVYAEPISNFWRDIVVELGMRNYGDTLFISNHRMIVPGIVMMVIVLIVIVWVVGKLRGLVFSGKASRSYSANDSCYSGGYKVLKGTRLVHTVLTFAVSIALLKYSFLLARPKPEIFTRNFLDITYDCVLDHFDSESNTLDCKSTLNTIFRETSSSILVFGKEVVKGLSKMVQQNLVSMSMSETQISLSSAEVATGISADSVNTEL